MKKVNPKDMTVIQAKLTEMIANEWGWSVGCPRYCINDGIHGNIERLANHNFNSREKAIEWWKCRAKRG